MWTRRIRDLNRDSGLVGPVGAGHAAEVEDLETQREREPYSGRSTLSLTNSHGHLPRVGRRWRGGLTLGGWKQGENRCVRSPARSRRPSSRITGVSSPSSSDGPET